MRMSCNGCRVLRKGCGDDCTIKPCLQWIKSPKSQANATLFLAKFYGRTGLVNLINAGPDHLRPAIFRSLLYEACGRMVNPIYGSVGLLWTRSWHLCQAAVEAVLRGDQITPVSSELAIKGCDIRHVSKDSSSCGSDQLHKVKSKSKAQFKRSAPKTKLKAEPAFEFGQLSDESVVSWAASRRCDGGEDRSSVETVEVSPAKIDEAEDGSDVELELTLGFNFK